MAPQKMEQQQVTFSKTAELKKKMKKKKNSKVRKQVKQMKAEMGMVRQQEESIREEQRRIRLLCGEVGRQCDQLKTETKMIRNQTARTQIKLVLMFRILKAREAGDCSAAATLTHFLREFVARETENASLQSDDEDEDF